MELTGVKDSHLPGSQAASARQTQARRVPNLEQFVSDFFVWDAHKLMTSLQISITNGQLSP
jgi:hypothetical protein